MSDNCRGRIFRLLYPVFFKCKLKKNKLKRLFINIVLYVLCKHGPFCFYPKSSTDHKRGNPLKVGNNLWKEVQPGKPSFSVFLRNELNSSLALRHSSKLHRSGERSGDERTNDYQTTLPPHKCRLR